PPGQQAVAGKRVGMGDAHQDYRRDQRGGGCTRRSARPGQQAQPLLDAAQILAQPVQRVHAASLSTDKCWFPTIVSATASARAASSTYHQNDRFSGPASPPPAALTCP